MSVSPLAILILITTLAIIGHGFTGWRMYRAQTSTIARFIAELSVFEMLLGVVAMIVGACMVL